jgi:hypothetical protein
LPIHCQTVFGRAGEATVSLDPDTGRVLVSMPAPGTGTFDWDELDRLAAAIAEVRKQMPGRPS